MIDKLGQAGDFEDLSKVEKYEMSPDEYAKRGGECNQPYMHFAILHYSVIKWRYLPSNI